MRYPVLVLGGYGTFGRRICRSIAADAAIEVIIAGRDGVAAEHYAEELRDVVPGSEVRALGLDMRASDLALKLCKSGARALIHTSGPFQGQDYHVARACIEAGVHYIDFADSRSFVCGIGELNIPARRKNVLAVSGASTVPALSSAVADHYLPEFSALTTIDIGINPGNQTPRGLATVKAILSHCGKCFQRFENGVWKTVYGWQGLHRRRYPDAMGKRWLSNCDVPDLQLFPARYPGMDTVRFYAGLELGFLHLAVWCASWLARWNRVENWANHAALLKRISECFAGAGSGVGGMHVALDGLDYSGAPNRLTWHIIAGSGDGPQIPCVPSILLAKKLARDELAQRGAYPCMGFFTLKEFMNELSGLDVRQVIVNRNAT